MKELAALLNSVLNVVLKCNKGNKKETKYRKVFGFFLKDDDECSFDRSKFFGVIDEKYIPEWAKEKLEECNKTLGDLIKENGQFIGLLIACMAFFILVIVLLLSFNY